MSLSGFSTLFWSIGYPCANYCCNYCWTMILWALKWINKFPNPLLSLAPPPNIKFSLATSVGRERELGISAPGSYQKGRLTVDPFSLSESQMLLGIRQVRKWRKHVPHPGATTTPLSSGVAVPESSVPNLWIHLEKAEVCISCKISWLLNAIWAKRNLSVGRSQPPGPQCAAPV